ncbi:hypothetical protein ABZ816_34135 [Actinosynnema sp. NPDC047251]|uniref:Uncharacterized protein n=1 Tax=Saccharothrix espanaensis (strain ATCC 51144 / DSM 44229 / JCM 9112 / NBRC 15066 / NRRL 15764) TaxID=1179773 RepID=K0K6Q5_SACES|nr:hypothetical protein [Saccharothrix espanaensis]CCH32258.1 hypothetical protein BN6_49900 [Saccharothrix espanaensis DSM 44229]
MTAPTQTAPTQTAAAEFEGLVGAATTRLDRVAGTSPGHRPAHLAQLDAVLRAAVQQAKQAEAGSSAVDRDADLWRLREPGYLRGIADHPVDRPSSTLPLLPVVVTWAFLGYAEWAYVTEFASSPAAGPSSFFADWLAQPMWRSPVGLSITIVVTVLVIMHVYRKPAQAQRRADEIDRVVHRLEVDLLPSLTVLRAGLGPVQVEEHTRQAAVELGAAAKLFTSATVKLAESTAVVDRLVAGVERLVTALPELGAQAAKLDEVRRDLDQTARLIGTQLEPLATVVTDVSGAAESAREAVIQSGVVLERADAQLADARSVAERHERHREALAAAQQPFTAVADVVAGAAGSLDRTSALLEKTIDELRATVDGVNWLAMVSDGLRHPDERHDPGTAA